MKKDRSNFKAVAVLSPLMLLTACGGGDPTSHEANASQAQVAAEVNAAAPDSNDPHTLVLDAFVYAASPAPEVEVSVDGHVVGRATIVPETTSYPFQVEEGLRPGSRVDVAILRANEGGNFFVHGVTALGSRMNAYEVPFDRGELDGNDVVRGPYRLSPGTLRFKVPGETNLVTVWAKSFAPDDASQRIELLVDGRSVGQRWVVKGPQNPPPPRSRGNLGPWHSMLPYVFAVPFDIQPGTRLDVAYENAHATADLGDRYVVVGGVQARGSSVYTAEFDRGPLDGLDMNPQDLLGDQVSRNAMAWSGTLRFVVPDNNNAVMVQARGESAGGQAPVMAVVVDGQVMDRIPVKQAMFSPYRVVFSPAIDPQAEIQVSYVNDAVVDGVDRNLFISQLTLQDAGLLPGYESWRYLSRYHLGPVLGVDVRSLSGPVANMYWTGTVDFETGQIQTRTSCSNSVDYKVCSDWLAAQKTLATQTPSD